MLFLVVDTYRISDDAKLLAEIYCKLANYIFNREKAWEMYINHLISVCSWARIFSTSIPGQIRKNFFSKIFK